MKIALKDIEIDPSKNVKMYSLSLRFNYIEVNTQLQTRDTLYIDWTFSPKTATEFQLNGNSNLGIDFSINPIDFYKYLITYMQYNEILQYLLAR